MKKGLLIVNTGDSRRTSSTALGTALRALGRGFKVCVIRFVEANPPAESDLGRVFDGMLVIHQFDCAGKETTQSGTKGAADAANAWKAAKAAIRVQDYDLVVLDGLHYLVESGAVTEQQVLDLIANRPEALHVIVTGDFMPESLFEAADLVTDAHAVKCPSRSTEQHALPMGLD